MKVGIYSIIGGIIGLAAGLLIMHLMVPQPEPIYSSMTMTSHTGKVVLKCSGGEPFKVTEKEVVAVGLNSDRKDKILADDEWVPLTNHLCTISAPEAAR